MGEVVLVRHGQASFGADDYDKLSPLGHQQAIWLGEYFVAHGMAFDRVLRGQLRRHRETADGISRAMALPAIEEDPRLDEFHYHPLEDEYLRETGTDAPKSRDNFLNMFPELLTNWENGKLTGSGESYETFSTRVYSALDAAVAADRSVLVVTSGGVIGTVLRRVLGLGPASAADLILSIHNASVHRLKLEGGRMRLSLFNASPHLDPLDRAHARTYV